MPVLVDTGILYALTDADDAWHERAVEWVDGTSDLLIVPTTVLPEVAYLLHERLGADVELKFLQSIAAGELELEEIRRQDLARCCEIMARYPELGFVDASIVTVAERLKIRTVATTDRRHFNAVSPTHAKRFETVP